MKPITFHPLGPCNVDMTGEKYGFLTVLGYAGYDMRIKRRAAMWYCKCENCGKVRKFARTALRFGRAKSCGKKGCKAESAKQFPPHPTLQRYNRTSRDRKRAIREARRHAAMLAKVQFAARTQAEKQVPKLRRAIDTPERWYAPTVAARAWLQVAR